MPAEGGNLEYTPQAAPVVLIYKEYHSLRASEHSAEALYALGLAHGILLRNACDVQEGCRLAVQDIVQRCRRQQEDEEDKIRVMQDRSRVDMNRLVYEARHAVRLLVCAWRAMERVGKHDKVTQQRCVDGVFSIEESAKRHPFCNPRRYPCMRNEVINPTDLL